MTVRKLLTAGFMFACTLLAMTARLSAEDQLPWAEDFAAACQQANAQGKVVLLHFVCDNCTYCVRLEKNVFSQPEVGAAVGRSCVPVKIHAGKTPALAARYQVRAYPTDIFVTPAGLELTRSVSPQSPTDYIAMVNAVATTAGTAIAKGANANGVIAQVSNQAAANYNYLTQTAAQSAQQIQSSAQQTQQAAQQQAQQQWQNAQTQAGQYAANAQQAAQQTAQTAQQQTQAAADQAKEVINRYSQPFQQAATGWQPPMFTSPSAAQSPPLTSAATDAAVQQHYLQPNQPPAAPAVQPQTPPPAAVQPPAENASTVIASGNYPVAMEGYCPVTLAVERKWKKGQPQFGAVHRRRTFLFTSEAEQKKFLADPDRYSPVMVGYDPVRFMQTGELVDGRATYSLTYRKQVYLFNDDTSLKSFWQNPSQFTEGLRQAMTRAENKIR